MSAVHPRGPKIFVGVVALALVGIGIWFFFLRTPGPLGAPEDPGKVLLVGSEPSIADELELLGLEVEHGTPEELQTRAQAEVEGLDETGPLAILDLADQLGIGYVAFADPQSLSFGDLPVTSDSAAVAPNHRFVVLSVGELAQPHHHVTVGRDDGLYPLPPTLELLRALFEQERLAATLVGEEKLAPIAKPLFERVEPAIEMLGGYGMLDAKARRIERERAESLDEPEEADPKPSTLADALEISWGFPVANGGIALFSERPRITSARDADVSLSYAGVAEAFFLPAGKTSTADREPCEAPGSGAPLHGATITTNGDAMLRPAGDRVEVWSMPASTRGCPFARKGTIPLADGPLGSVNAEGRVLRPVDVDGEQMVEVWTAGDSQPQVWPMSGCTQLGIAEWIDDVHFAIACRYHPPAPPEPDPYSDDPPPSPDPATPVLPEQTWIYLSSTQTGQVLAWPIDDGYSAYLPGLHLRRGTKTLSLVAHLDSARLLLLDAPASVTALFDAPPQDPALPHPLFVPADEAGIAALPSSAFTTKLIEIDPTSNALALSPTGTHAAFEVDRDPYNEWSTNVAVLDFASGRTKRVAIDRWAAHEHPRFTADGKTLVFTSRYSADERTMTALRTVAVP
jgi:hypothetical protein